jgi:hypothetical protein
VAEDKALHAAQNGTGPPFQVRPWHGQFQPREMAQQGVERDTAFHPRQRRTDAVVPSPNERCPFNLFSKSRLSASKTDAHPDWRIGPRRARCRRAECAFPRVGCRCGHIETWSLKRGHRSAMTSVILKRDRVFVRESDLPDGAQDNLKLHLFKPFTGAP